MLRCVDKETNLLQKRVKSENRLQKQGERVALVTQTDHKPFICSLFNIFVPSLSFIYISGRWTTCCVRFLVHKSQENVIFVVQERRKQAEILCLNKSCVVRESPPNSEGERFNEAGGLWLLTFGIQSVCKDKFSLL